MKPLDIDTVANFFDEVEEGWLELFDWCPNEQLPHAQRKTYRIKDLFKAKYFRKTCRYLEDEIEYCRTEFHMIFRDNIMHAMQAGGELDKLKKMADGDMYDSHQLASRAVDITNSSDGTDTTTSNNRGNVKNKQGMLAGTVDSVQVGNVLDETMRVIDTNKLPEFFDRNVRQYNQTAGVDENITDVTITNSNTNRGNTTTKGTQTNNVTQGITALNEIRAHSLQVRRIREEFVQCFNVLYY